MSDASFPPPESRDDSAMTHRAASWRRLWDIHPDSAVAILKGKPELLKEADPETIAYILGTVSTAILRSLAQSLHSDQLDARHRTPASAGVIAKAILELGEPHWDLIASWFPLMTEVQRLPYARWVYLQYDSALHRSYKTSTAQQWGWSRVNAARILRALPDRASVGLAPLSRPPRPTLRA